MDGLGDAVDWAIITRPGPPRPSGRRSDHDEPVVQPTPASMSRHLASTPSQRAAYGLDDIATALATIGHVLDHLAAYLPGLDALPPQHLLPAQPLCDPVRAWIVNRLGDASEQYPEVVIPLLHRAAEDYHPTLEDTDA